MVTLSLIENQNNISHIVRFSPDQCSHLCFCCRTCSIQLWIHKWKLQVNCQASLWVHAGRIAGQHAITKASQQEAWIAFLIYTLIPLPYPLHLPFYIIMEPQQTSFWSTLSCIWSCVYFAHPVLSTRRLLLMTLHEELTLFFPFILIVRSLDFGSLEKAPLTPPKCVLWSSWELLPPCSVTSYLLVP